MTKLTFVTLCLFVTQIVFSQSKTPLTLTAAEVVAASYTDKAVTINGKTNLHLYATTKLLVNSTIQLNSENSWVFFDNLRPSVVIDSLLQNILINGQAPIIKTTITGTDTVHSNVRVTIYRHGTVIIPQPDNFKPFKVYTKPSFKGDSALYSLYTFNNSLGVFDNQIRSFKLKRGYMATLATSADGMGYSRVFIADDKDLEFSIMPSLLDTNVSFIRVAKWEWPSKKGWCGYTATEYGMVEATWRYDWSASGNSTSSIEYVPIKQDNSWPTWSTINAKLNVSHLLGYNEPDHTEQANVTVAQAVAQWPNMLKSGLRVGTPACTSFTWLYQFMDSCKAHNYRVDYVAIHSYWGGLTPQKWYSDLKAIHDKTGRPIWITEWNNGANWTTETWPTDSLARLQKQLTDLKAILNVLDTAHFIERYSIYNWVGNHRAMVLGGGLTPAGKYYADNKPPLAYRAINEVIPTFTYQAPSFGVSYGANKTSINIINQNLEYFKSHIIEKKQGNGAYVEFARTDIASPRLSIDTIDLNGPNKLRYRVKSILTNGATTAYSDEEGYDISNGGDIQYGNLSFNSVGWNTVMFKKPFSYTNLPAMILGAPSNNNATTLIVPRPKLLSPTLNFAIQLAPWLYQNTTTLSKDESVPYLITGLGSFDFGNLKAKSARTSITGAWTNITFATPFDTIPVVFVSQFSPSTAFATAVRVRNVTKTGFQARLQKESKVTTALTQEVIAYFAITQGIGIIDGKKIIVGKTATNAITTSSATTINYGDSIANPIFLAQMQTCNDDTVTAGLRCMSTSAKYATVMKQREKSLGILAAASEAAGWLVINPVSIIQRIENVHYSELSVYPNPVKDQLFINRTNEEPLDIEIYNLFGVLQKRMIIVGNKIDVSDLQKGYYIIKSTGKFSSKFIKL